jgi:hypothetical protein
MFRIFLSTLIFMPSLLWAQAELTDIAHGMKFGCAVSKDQKLYCWGNNEKILSAVPNLTGVTQVATFTNHVCALAGGKVSCWGENKDGQTTVPPNLTDVVSIAVGGAYSCGATTTKVTCWGRNPEFGNLFNKQFTDIKKIVVENNSSLRGSYWHLCLQDGKKADCFSTVAQELINPPVDLGDIQDIRAGMRFACGLSSAGWKCWGDTPYYKNLFAYPEHELVDIDSKMYHSHQYCSIKDGMPSCGGSSRPLSDMVGLKKLTVSPVDSEACGITSEGVRCWGPMYNSALKYPISNDIQKVSKRLNESELDNFLGCYSDGVKLYRETSKSETYPDGKAVEQIRVGGSSLLAFAATDDIIKAIPGKELLIISKTPKVYVSSGEASTNRHRVRVFKKTDGTYGISSSYGWLWNITKEQCQ